MLDPTRNRITLQDLRRAAAEGRPFAMLTAYDFPTAQAAQAARVPSLLIGDSMGSVLLGLESTRDVPLELMITLGNAVRRGAPNVFLIGDLPYECISAGPDGVLNGARRFCQECGCDAVKVEVLREQAPLVRTLVDAGYVALAHLGLRPQSVTSRDQLKAQARDEDSIRALVDEARLMVDCGAAMLLLEAVPAEASQAVVSAVDMPVIGCGAGPACHAHVVVTYDMLGIGAMRAPRFVPVLAQLGRKMEEAMRRFVQDIESGAYPGPQHIYGMRKQPAGSGTSRA
jgi:3-methyl-2-oxobutanoate hydroxymethyltransferase